MQGRALALALLVTLGCEEKKGGPPTGGADAPAAAPAVLTPADEAKELAQNRCANCHGASGRGDGPSAATLNPKPRDFTSKDWQKSVTDAQLKAIIVKGGGSSGKSVLMPANPDLESKPEVVAALVQIVRAYGK